MIKMPNFDPINLDNLESYDNSTTVWSLWFSKLASNTVLDVKDGQRENKVLTKQVHTVPRIWRESKIEM